MLLKKRWLGTTLEVGGSHNQAKFKKQSGRKKNEFIAFLQIVCPLDWKTGRRTQGSYSYVHFIGMMPVK